MPGDDQTLPTDSSNNMVVEPTGSEVALPTLQNTVITANKTSSTWFQNSQTSSGNVKYRSSNPVQAVANALPMFLNVCPDTWSLPATSASTVAGRSDGSGYFTSQTAAKPATGSGTWWSTNSLAGFILSAGQYYSKNSSIFTSGHILMGWVQEGTSTVGSTTVGLQATTMQLVWGALWGLGSYNYFYDYKPAGSSAYVPVSYPVPMSNGAVNVSALNASVIANCPPVQAFVMLDMDDLVFAYLVPDIEPNTPRGVRDTSMTNVLPLYSQLTALPTFQSGVTVGLTTYSGAAFTLNMSLSSMDYSHVWLKAFTGYDQSKSTSQGSTNSTLAPCQVSGIGQIVSNPSTPVYVGFGSVQQYVASSAICWYSGWLRAGTSTQMCGWFLQTSTGNNQVQLVTTAYGFTSLSPTAMSNVTGYASNSVYNLTTSNTQSEICANAFLPSTQGALGFMYDASVGTFGQVIWLSQI